MEHKHDDPDASLEYAHVYKSTIYVTMLMNYIYFSLTPTLTL